MTTLSKIWLGDLPWDLRKYAHWCGDEGSASNSDDGGWGDLGSDSSTYGDSYDDGWGGTDYGGSDGWGGTEFGGSDGWGGDSYGDDGWGDTDYGDDGWGSSFDDAFNDSFNDSFSDSALGLSGDDGGYSDVAGGSVGDMGDFGGLEGIGDLGSTAPGMSSALSDDARTDPDADDIDSQSQTTANAGYQTDAQAGMNMGNFSVDPMTGEVSAQIGDQSFDFDTAFSNENIGLLGDNPGGITSQATYSDGLFSDVYGPGFTTGIDMGYAAGVPGYDAALGGFTPTQSPLETMDYSIPDLDPLETVNPYSPGTIQSAGRFSIGVPAIAGSLDYGKGLVSPPTQEVPDIGQYDMLQGRSQTPNDLMGNLANPSQDINVSANTVTNPDFQTTGIDPATGLYSSAQYGTIGSPYDVSAQAAFQDQALSTATQQGLISAQDAAAVSQSVNDPIGQAIAASAAYAATQGLNPMGGTIHSADTTGFTDQNVASLGNATTTDPTETTSVSGIDADTLAGIANQGLTQAAQTAYGAQLGVPDADQLAGIGNLASSGLASSVGLDGIPDADQLAGIGNMGLTNAAQTAYGAQLGTPDADQLAGIGNLGLTNPAQTAYGAQLGVPDADQIAGIGNMGLATPATSTASQGIADVDSNYATNAVASQMTDMVADVVDVDHAVAEAMISEVAQNLGVSYVEAAEVVAETISSVVNDPTLGGYTDDQIAGTTPAENISGADFDAIAGLNNTTLTEPAQTAYGAQLGVPDADQIAGLANQGLTQAAQTAYGAGLGIPDADALAGIGNLANSGLASPVGLEGIPDADQLAGINNMDLANPAVSLTETITPTADPYPGYSANLDEIARGMMDDPYAVVSDAYQPGSIDVTGTGFIGDIGGIPDPQAEPQIAGTTIGDQLPSGQQVIDVMTSSPVLSMGQTNFDTLMGDPSLMEIAMSGGGIGQQGGEGGDSQYGGQPIDTDGDGEEDAEVIETPEGPVIIEYPDPRPYLMPNDYPAFIPDNYGGLQGFQPNTQLAFQATGGSPYGGQTQYSNPFPWSGAYSSGGGAFA